MQSVHAALLPHIVSFAIGLSVPDETSAGLIQVLAAFRALEAGRVPLQVGGDSQYVLVMDLASTSYTHRESWLLCKDHTHTHAVVGVEGLTGNPRTRQQHKPVQSLHCCSFKIVFCRWCRCPAVRTGLESADRTADSGFAPQKR